MITKSIYVCAVRDNESYTISGSIEAVIPHPTDMLLLYSRKPFSVHLVGRSREAKEIEMEFDFMPKKCGVLVTLPQDLTISASVKVAPCHRL